LAWLVGMEGSTEGMVVVAGWAPCGVAGVASVSAATTWRMSCRADGALRLVVERAGVRVAVMAFGARSGGREEVGPWLLSRGPMGSQWMDQWRRLSSRAPGTAVAAMEKAKGAACSWGSPAMALAMAALIRSLIEPLSGLREVLRVTRSAGSASALAPGARIECRRPEWLVCGIGRSSDGQQVVDAVGVRFAGKGLNVVAVEPFEAVATRLQLSSQLRFAVMQANSYLRTCGEQWTARVQLELEAQRQRLRRLRGRQEKQKAIDGRFLDRERFLSEVMTIDPAPYLKLVAVLHREA
jgi:hypothetical protein